MRPGYVLTVWNLAACVRSTFAAASGFSLVLTTDSSNPVAMSAELMLCGDSVIQSAVSEKQYSTSTCH